MDVIMEATGVGESNDINNESIKGGQWTRL